MNKYQAYLGHMSVTSCIHLGYISCISCGYLMDILGMSHEYLGYISYISKLYLQ